MRISCLTISLLSLTLLADARLFSEQLKIQAGDNYGNNDSLLAISKNRLRTLVEKNFQSVRTQLTRTVQRCSETASPTVANRDDSVTPSPTTPAPTSRTWDQIGSDLNGKATEEVGTNIQLNEDGTLLLATGISLLKMYQSGVDDFNVRSWVLKDDLSSFVTGKYISARLGSDRLGKNGETLVVGDPEDGNGKAFVLNLKGTTWELKGTFSGVNPKDEFGYSVDISDDGKIIVIGAPGGDYAKFFDLLNQGVFWTLVLDDYSNGFGKSISIANNGNFLAVGAYNNTEVVGSVYVYELEDFYVIQRFDGNRRSTSNGYSFGHSVSMNEDGMVLAIGSYEEDVVQFLRYNPKRNQYDDIGPPASNYAGSNFGRSVALSHSGDTAIVGAPGFMKDTVSAGRAEAYSLSFDSWNFIGGFLGEDEDDEFGTAVAFSGDGTVVAIGGLKNAGGGEDAGHVRAYSLL